MEFKESTLSIDFHNHRATVGYRDERSGVAIHLSGLPLTTTTSELEVAVQDRVRREARAILAGLVAELELPGV